MSLLRALLFGGKIGEECTRISSPSSPSLPSRPFQTTERDAPSGECARAEDLSVAYRQYWSLAETEPLEACQAAYREIVRLETQGPPAVAWRTLREAAVGFHSDTGLCPFCRTPGDLHLPAEQLEMEVRGEGREASCEV